MTKSLKITSILAIAVLVVGFFYFNQPVSNVESAGYIPSHIQSATTTTVGPDTIVTIFDDQVSATCNSRVISTTDSAIMISFGDVSGFGSTTVSATAGHWQPASTTVAYDSALYGCGLYSAYGYSSTTLTVSSF